jgi:MFS family permease
MSTESAVLTGMQAVETVDERRRNAVRGAVFSEYIDMFDIYLPAVVLTPILLYFRAPNTSPELQVILDSFVIVTTLIGRPFGATLFGMIADRLGRRTASIYSVAGFAIVTFLIALLPGYQTIGISSYLLLVVLRFADGIFLGGGYTGSIPLAFEYSAKSTRGLVGGLIMVGFPAAYVSITLISMLMFALFPAHGIDSPYAQWGWRIPFVIGAILAGSLALYYVFKVRESDVWEVKAAKGHKGQTKLPLSQLLGGSNAKSLVQVLLMMTGFWLTQNLMTIFVPSVLLPSFLKLSPLQLTVTLLISYVILMFSYVGAGTLSQRIGRRRFFLIAGPLIATVGTAIMYYLSNATELSIQATVVLVCVMSIVVTAPWGVIITYINERFATDVRATGFGVAFSLSVIIPSFYAVYMSWLGSVMPYRATPAVLLCLGGIIGSIGAAMGPETKDVDF